ncbi:MAG: hypothetical protein KZQ59_02740 [Candidatus Thiodiazotropha sp. (ex Lucinoma aequizonata)]|nr:hypothetical protein [Candidatus Thiodiazotropha sp. (ex Lucinoma aequizonata)]MCU7899109.1 hypothetical protein [Candidatus Thiodiazotropha sp. (ex Lucinoma aequizonata)]MCU7907826.1 hypothetical protein [Candidatus Thiodiazotropha sp. (ex Lucinoma aequizonata)]
MRISSGTGTVKDGDVLEQRIMTGGQGLIGSIKEEAGYWTVTLKRKLKSDNQGDMIKKSVRLYNFCFAIHDDYTNTRFHHVSLSYKLGLDNNEAEINALAQ